MNKNSLRSSIFVLEITFLGLFKWLMCEARFMAAYSKTFSVRKTAMTNLKKKLNLDVRSHISFTARS